MDRFHLGAKSGLITVESANAVLFAWRNAHASKHQFISQLWVKWRTVDGFTAEQEVALDVLPVTAFGATPANYTGGTDLSDYSGTDGAAVLATNAIRPRSKDRSRPSLDARSCLETGNVRIATTTALAHAGSPTIATHPWLSDSMVELDTGATVARNVLDMRWEAPGYESGAVDYEGCWQIKSGEGFIITAPIALGAGGTGRLIVEVDWLES